MRGLGRPRRRQRVRATIKDDHHSVAQNRRIYDPRRWHKRSGYNSSSDSGQPPAGWVLVWAGRFKRWRRRWFVAHPAGLLLYYKNSDQIGRPGCINLLGARIDTAKDRQIKIVRGPIVYYLRATNKEYRQEWLDAIGDSVRTYNKSLQKASIGALPGQFLFPRESYTHPREECEQEEKELSRRLAGRLQDIESVRQVFLLKLQELQRSLSVISETLGFSNQRPGDTLRTPSPATNQSDDRVLTPSRMGDVDIFQTPKDNGTHRSLFGRKAAKQQKSVLMDRFSSPDHIPKNLRCRSMSLPVSGSMGHDCMLIHDPENCASRECFRWWKKDGCRMASVEIRDFHANIIGVPLSKKRMSSDLAIKDNCNDASSSTQTCCTNRSSVLELPEHSVTTSYASEMPKPLQPRAPAIEGSLHAAWNNLQESYAEALKDEIRRVIELEAENLVLQESLAMLPQLQKDRLALMELRARLQKDGIYKEEFRHGHKEEDEDSDDEISIVPTEVTNEEYFEALEVLNQHEFIARSSSTEEQENLAERVDGTQEPPEEGECLEMLSEAELEDSDQPRARLPAPRPLSMGFSLWTVLKNAIGKDLNHITMPATINEPLSALQRCAEQMQYRDLLELAAQQASSMERLLLVSAFACASYYSSICRDAKPFNPMLGETYEWQAPDGRARFISEQVSHHPPIMAFQGESTSGDFIFYGEIEIKNKFWGKSVEVLPVGLCHVRLPGFEDHFTWNQVTTCIHNIVMGKLWMDNYGEMVIKNQTTGENCRVRFHKASSREQGRISGKAYSSSDDALFSLYGNYMDSIFAISEPNITGSENTRCLWRSPERPEDYNQQYCFSQFAIGLNELTPKLAKLLPPTDSRFRPDQRALEDGDLEKATPEKFRLEEKQRVARKLRKEKGIEWKSIWFRERRVDVVGEDEPAWKFDGKYWEFREEKIWDECPDIM